MNNKPKAIVLGGTTPHIELIENLKKRGYYTVLVDYLDNPPAKIFADEHIKESTLEKDKVCEIAKNIKASLVISTCIDQANVTACYVAEKLNLPRPYSYETALNVTNKGLMKEILISNKIPTSKYIYIESIQEFNKSNLNFPIIIKPADSCGSSGVKIINDLNSLIKYFDFTKSISRIGKVIVEEVVIGKELSAYCFIDNNFDAQVIMLSQRLSKIEGNNEVIKCYTTITPPSISDKSKIKIELYAKKIANIFNLKNTPLHLQVFVNNEDISVIEFAPRVGGGISFKTISDNTGFNIIDSAVDSFLNKIVNVNFSPVRHFSSINIIYSYEGVFNKIYGHKHLLESGIIDSIFLYKNYGDMIKNDTASHSRIGAYIINANSLEELIKRMKFAINSINVYDINNREIINKGIFDSFEKLI